MEIIFTKHAKVRMFQREISEEEIRLLVEYPDTIKESFGERVAARKKFSKGIMEVIYKKLGNNTVIITCYWVKKEE